MTKGNTSATCTCGERITASDSEALTKALDTHDARYLREHNSLR